MSRHREHTPNVIAIDADRGEEILFWKRVRCAGYCITGAVMVGVGVFALSVAGDSFIQRMFSVSLILLGGGLFVIAFRKRKP
jgi:hypothetical protein